MTGYAKGKKAWGICDRTGMRYLLSDLVYEVQNGERTGLRVGRDVFDEDHPQNHIGKVRVEENINLYDPRPDQHVDGLFGFDPVGNDATYMLASTGSIKVVIS